MGSARHRSWSHTRQKTYDECPRALYYAYFPWGDPDQNLARFLRRAKRPDSIAGTIVHEHVVLGLRNLLRRGQYIPNLAESALVELEDAYVTSRSIARIVRAGKRPPDEGACMFHHLYGAEDVAGEEAGRRIVRTCLENFENSLLLEFLKCTNFDRWERILTNTDNVPSFQATAELGFNTAIGLRIYAAYDLALHVGDEFIVLDWKTGTKSAGSIAASRRQLAVYGLWAMSKGIEADKVRVQAVWLQENAVFDPVPLNSLDVRCTIESVEEQDTIERSATAPIADKNGVIVRYEVEREALPARPDIGKCGWCPYRSICGSAL